MAVLGETLIFFSRGNSFHKVGSRGLVRPVKCDEMKRKEERKMKLTCVKNLCEEGSSQNDGACDEESRRRRDGSEIDGSDDRELDSMVVGKKVVEKGLELDLEVLWGGHGWVGLLLVFWETYEDDVGDVVACLCEL